MRSKGLERRGRKESIEFVERNKERPFFLYLALTVPHANNERTRALGDGAEVPDYGLYGAREWSPQLKGHAAMISRMDADIGRLLEKLRELRLTNTIVFFTSDNGPHKESGQDPKEFEMKDYPLVLIHGYPFDHTMWFSAIASLGANAKVIAPDLPGFGKTPLPAGEAPSLEFMADFIAHVIGENHAEKAVVAGMSMGGYVALAFAERHADRLAGLGLVSTQAAADTAETRKARSEMIEKIRAGGPSVAVNALLPKMFATEEPRNPDLKEYPERASEKAGADGLCWALEAMAKRPDRTSVVKKLSVPVLVAHGTSDRIIPFVKARELAESCANPIFVEVAGAGHATPLEGPDTVAAGLARLMKKCREEQILAEQKPA